MQNLRFVVMYYNVSMLCAIMTITFIYSSLCLENDIILISK